VNLAISRQLSAISQRYEKNSMQLAVGSKKTAGRRQNAAKSKKDRDDWKISKFEVRTGSSPLLGLRSPVSTVNGPRSPVIRHRSTGKSSMQQEACQQLAVSSRQCAVSSNTLNSYEQRARRKERSAECRAQKKTDYGLRTTRQWTKSKATTGQPTADNCTTQS